MATRMIIIIIDRITFNVEVIGIWRGSSYKYKFVGVLK